MKLEQPPPGPKIGAPQISALRTCAPSELIESAARIFECDLDHAGELLARACGLRWLDASVTPSLRFRTDLIAPAEARARRCLIAEINGAHLGLLVDPFSQATRVFLESAAFPAPLALTLTSLETFEAALRRIEADHRFLNSNEAEVDLPTAEVDEIALRLEPGSESLGSAVSLINAVFLDALKATASDIHIESTPLGLSLKFRVDGLLETMQAVNGRPLAEQVLSRLKVLANLDIAERRRPQDGRFRVGFSGRIVDVRLSIMPSIHGEDAVLRLLDKSSLVPPGEQLTLEALGFDAADLTRLRALASLPYGMLLVTGPTGSGKTTTLYAVLSEINTGRDKIVTIEDPVEYQLSGVLQVPVNEKKGLTFAVGLRSILRHDPDRIMVGEIRDTETADIAVQAALTGHLVLTTVHANNVFDVIGRFTHMGIDPYTLVSALTGIWAQRLMRRVCPECALPADAADSFALGISPGLLQPESATWMKARGCPACRGTGYKGRLAIAEILVLDNDIRQTIIDRRPAAELLEAARARGARLLREAALAAAARGVTTMDEVQRVTRND
jgi:general secretion pathway protein E